VKRSGQVCNFLNSSGKLLQGSGGPGFITPTYDESGRNAAIFIRTLSKYNIFSLKTLIQRKFQDGITIRTTHLTPNRLMGPQTLLVVCLVVTTKQL
jgi:hypothetical protein